MQLPFTIRPVPKPNQSPHASPVTVTVANATSMHAAQPQSLPPTNISTVSQLPRSSPRTKPPIPPLLAIRRPVLCQLSKPHPSIGVQTVHTIVS